MSFWMDSYSVHSFGLVQLLLTGKKCQGSHLLWQDYWNLGPKRSLY